MFSDAESAPAAETPTEEKDEDAGQTAIVPQSLCPGMKVGDEMKVRIERVLENDYEISYPEQKPEQAEAPAAVGGGGGSESELYE